MLINLGTLTAPEKSEDQVTRPRAGTDWLGSGGVGVPHCVATVRDLMYCPYPQSSHPSPTSLNRAAASPEQRTLDLSLDSRTLCIHYE